MQLSADGQIQLFNGAVCNDAYFLLTDNSLHLCKKRFVFVEMFGILFVFQSLNFTGIVAFFFPPLFVSTKRQYVEEGSKGVDVDTAVDASSVTAHSRSEAGKTQILNF